MGWDWISTDDEIASWIASIADDFFVLRVVDTGSKRETCYLAFRFIETVPYLGKELASDGQSEQVDAHGLV